MIVDINSREEYEKTLLNIDTDKWTIRGVTITLKVDNLEFCYSILGSWIDKELVRREPDIVKVFKTYDEMIACVEQNINKWEREISENKTEAVLKSGILRIYRPKITEVEIEDSLPDRQSFMKRLCDKWIRRKE